MDIESQTHYEDDITYDNEIKITFPKTKRNSNKM